MHASLPRTVEGVLLPPPLLRHVLPVLLLLLLRRLDLHVVAAQQEWGGAHAPGQLTPQLTDRQQLACSVLVRMQLWVHTLLFFHCQAAACPPARLT